MSEHTSITTAEQEAKVNEAITAYVNSETGREMADTWNKLNLLFIRTYGFELNFDDGVSIGMVMSFSSADEIREMLLR